MGLNFRKFDFQSEEILSVLFPENQQKVLSQFKKIFYKKGATIFKQGGLSSGIFLVVSGKAKIFKTGAYGKEQIFYLYKTGELLGYHALIADERYEDSCEAITDCEMLFLDREKFTSLIEEIPALKTLLIKNMSHEFGVLVNTITILAQIPVRERAAFFLLYLQYRFKEDDNPQGLIVLKREDLANIIGTTRETFGRLLKDFKDDGLITIEHKAILIKDFDKLQKIACVIE